MKDFKTDKELLVELAAWGERALAAAGGRFGSRPDQAMLKQVKEDFGLLQSAIAAAVKGGAKLAAERIVRQAGLNELETQALYVCLYHEFVERGNISVPALIRAVGAVNGIPLAEAAALLQGTSPLIQKCVLAPSNCTGILPGSVEISATFKYELLGLRVMKRKPAPAKPPRRPLQELTARQIHAGLAERVVGQEEAKKRVASAVFRHLKATELNQKREQHERIQKANILIIGPTGTGKTHIARTLSYILRVPFAACDATQYTESGYVGMNVEDMLLQLLKASGRSPEAMQDGIIYIDEIDKIAARDSRASHNSVKDVSGLSVQQELLKMLDGDRVSYSKRSGYGEQEHEFQVGGVLFVAGGAFQGLDEIVKARLNRKAAIGFTGSAEAERAAKELQDDGWLKHVITEDLIEYGFIPEFIGRFASIVTLNPLAEADVLDILTKPKNSLLSQYQAILEAAGVSHVFSQEELKAVAKEAFALKTGARGLKAIMEARVAPLLFDGGQPELPGLQS